MFIKEKYPQIVIKQGLKKNLKIAFIKMLKYKYTYIYNFMIN